MEKASQQAHLSVRGRTVRIAGTVGAIIVSATAVLLIAFLALRRDRSATPLAFSGDSSALKATVIVPTLDTPAPAGRNVVWCASFQAAWDGLKDDVAKGPVRIAGAEELCGRLNAAALSEADLPSEGFYSAAGLVRDGIVGTIRSEMGRRFPAAPPPEFGPLDTGGFVAYGYLAAGAKFTVPFFENDEDLVFTGSNGGKTAVASFGIRRKDDYAYRRLREQVGVLYSGRVMGTPGTGCEFVIDPCRDSSPNQILLARIAPRSTLAATLAELDARVAEGPSDGMNTFGTNEVLLVPNMRFEIAHRFRELEQKHLSAAGLENARIDVAAQAITFRLDRSGAELTSEAKVHAAPVPRHFIFDRPFLVVMKKRSAGKPFFAMWVDNAELLCK